jgi:alkylated DNA repair dioxygenase AlkB
MSVQLPLLGRDGPRVDVGALARLARTDLDFGAWIEHAQGFVVGHATLFEALERGVAWEETTQHLYDKEVATPRLTAVIEDPSERWPLLREIADLLGRRYEVDFDRIGLALYRDGEDSVAWHRDRVLRQQRSGIVATVSVGETRPFLMRPHGGGPSIRFQLGWGDLFVMGGTCQRTWEHSVPKIRTARGPRISIMFRHSKKLEAKRIS